MIAPPRIPVKYHDSKRELTLQDCQECDYLAVQEWLDRHLRGDYLFKKGHLLSIIRRPTSKLYAILLDGMYCGTIVYYNGSVLHNIMIAEEFRGLGIGEACIRHLEPQLIRAKTNMQAGDPVPYYQTLGYKPDHCDPERPHIVVMTKDKDPVPVPSRPGPAGPVPTLAAPVAPVLTLPPELCTDFEDAEKWRAFKARQKKRQKERSERQRQLDGEYARRYDRTGHSGNSLAESNNGEPVYSE